MPNWTILKLLEWTSEYFAKHGIESPRVDAELLLGHVLKKKRLDLYLDFEKIVSEKNLAEFKALIQRRIKREPLQYIVGDVNFYGVSIKVTPDVLIPRPETELLVEKTLSKIPTSQRPPSEALVAGTNAPINILDLCTGSACIIAALANKLENAHFVGTDISEKALDVARQNIKNWGDRIELLHGDLFEPLSPPPLPSPLKGEGREKTTGSATSFPFNKKITTHIAIPSPLRGEGEGGGVFDVITANPPYVPEGELATLQPEVRDFEPKQALVAGKEGLEIIEKIIDNAHSFLKPGGHLIMEIGDGQADKVQNLACENGHYEDIDIIRDYGGIERIIMLKTILKY